MNKAMRSISRDCCLHAITVNRFIHYLVADFDKQGQKSLWTKQWENIGFRFPVLFKARITSNTDSIKFLIFIITENSTLHFR